MNYKVPPLRALPFRNSRGHHGTHSHWSRWWHLNKKIWFCILILHFFFCKTLRIIIHTTWKSFIFGIIPNKIRKSNGGSPRREHFGKCLRSAHWVVVGPPWKRRSSPRWGTCWRQRRRIRLRIHLIHQHSILHQLQLHLIELIFLFLLYVKL